MRRVEEIEGLGTSADLHASVFSGQGERRTGGRHERWDWLAENVFPHEPWLRRWLQRRGLDQDVEDIVQESYILLIQTERVDHVRHPRNYFCQTARSIILRNARRAAIVRMEHMSEAGPDHYISDCPLPDEQTAARQELDHLLKSLDHLPARTRNVFILRRLEGLSLIETAERLAISQSAVEKHLRAATRTLADCCGRAEAVL